MKLAIFDEQRLGAVVGGGVVDITAALPWPHDSDPLTAGWWRRLCRDYHEVQEALSVAAAGKPVLALDEVRLQAPVLAPTKIIASASNYLEHVQEMHAVQERTLGRVEPWMMDFDVFLKSPSSIIGPQDDIVLPSAVMAASHEVHHEAELVVIIGAGGRHIPEDEALSHVLGYTIGLDITVRSDADRSRRKSYDSFSPLGPWLTTREEAGDAGDFEIELACSGELRQKVNTSALIVPVAGLVSYASRMMTLLPGDVLFTGAPAGVAPIKPGDVITTSISRLGHMQLQVREE